MHLQKTKIILAVLLLSFVVKYSSGRVLTILSRIKHSIYSEISSRFKDDPKNKILIDQLGYKVNIPKLAFFKNEDPGIFEVIDPTNNSVAFKAKTDTPEAIDKATGDKVYVLNFTRFNKTGTYYLFLPQLKLKSGDFRIGQSVYNACAVKTLQSFYYQRCGIEINNGTKWSHPACHTKPAVFFNNPSKIKDVTGGWHDAGDYNKFVPTTAVSVAFLLFSYEYNPGFFYDGQLNIPESHNSIPDILDEAKWGLEWLLKMQRQDGAEYHKVSIKKWTGEHLPDKETDKQYIFGISSASTADASAVFAIGARIFNKYDKPFAMKLLGASIEAWGFLMQNKNNIPKGGFKNPPGVIGGEYNDPDDSDERLWASAALYRATGSDEYLKYFESHYKKVGGPNYTVTWKNTANFGLYSFLSLRNVSGLSELRNSILESLRNYADNLLQIIYSDGYRCALNPDEYFWGSNSVDLGYAFDLINAYRFTGQRKYLYGALDQLHYILGRNTFGISFVTGVGFEPVRYPYHQFSMLKTPGDPVPGLVVGGPNRFSEINGKTISNYPGRCYEDSQKNYFVNEPAINYTSPLVFVASYFSEADTMISDKRMMKIN